MFIKKIVLSSVLLCGVVLPSEQFFFSHVQKLNELEQQKVLAFLQEVPGNLTVELSNGIMQNEQFMAKCMPLFIQYDQEIVDIFDIFGNILNGDNDPSRLALLKTHLKTISHEIQQSSELTNFAKNLMILFCKWLPLIGDGIVASSNYKIIQDKKRCITDKERMGLFSEFVSTNIDVVHISLEHVVWSYNYLKKQFHAKGSLTTDDLCHVVKELGVTAKLPKKGHAAWNELILVFQNALNEAPQGVRKDLMLQVEQIMRKSDIDFAVKLLDSTAKMRHDVIKSNGSDQEKFAGYSKMLDFFINQIKKAQKQNTTKTINFDKIIAFIEKLLFKN